MTSSNQIKSGWSWQQKLKRTVEVLREEGIKSFWFKLLSEMGYRRVLWLKRSLEEPIPDVKPRLPVNIGLLKKTEVDEYIGFHTELQSSYLVSRLDVGHWCFVARYKGQMISATWATTLQTSNSYLAHEIRLRPGEVYIYYSFTSPGFRGFSVTPTIYVAMMRYFRDTGYQRMICWVLPENKPSLKALLKVGFRPLGMMRYIKIGLWRWHFYKTNKRYDFSDLKLRWWVKLAWRVYEYLPVPAEDFLKRCFQYILPFKGLYVPIVILRGTTRPDGHQGTLLVAGTEQGVDYIINRLFDGEYQREMVGKVPLWKLARTLKHLRTSADLTIARVDRLSARLFFGADYLAVPEWVGSTLTVPDDITKLTRGNPSLKSDLQIVHRNGLTYEVTRAEEDFEEFYYKMHVPFTRKRHGKQAFIRNVYWMRRAFRQGGLIWILLGSQRISGLLFRRSGNVLQSLAMGTASGEWEHIKEGAIAALYLFSIKLAKKLGCKLVDFGGCRPSLNDGLLRYKRKWKMNLIEKWDNYYDFLVYWNRFNKSVISFLSNTTLIFRNHHGLSAIYIINHDEPVMQSEAIEIHRSMWIPGLHRLYIVSTSGWQPAVSNPPQTHLVDATTSSNFDPSTLLTICNQLPRLE